MSEKWETVSSGKAATGAKKATNGKVATKNPKKEAKVYTVEDVLPAASVVNSFASAFDPVPTPKSTPKSPKKEANGKAAQVKAKVEKPRVPATLAEAVKERLRVEDLKNLIEDVQQRWPDSPLLWLRDVAQHLNQALVTQPEAAGEVLGGEPLSALTASMRKVITAMLQRCEENMRETFFETCVANTAHELAKGGGVAGWRCLTQLLAGLQPTAVTAHLPRYVELRNSYQNRPAVGLAILWSVGQAGHRSLHSGVKVWLEVMLPVLTLRHYTKYVVDYLAALLATHGVTPDTQLSKPVMDISNFLTVQDAVFVVSSTINKDCARALAGLYPSLRALALGGCRNHEIFPALLPRLATLSSQDQVVDSLEVLATCLAGTAAARVHWHQTYTSHLAQSGQLLHYLDSHWGRFGEQLDTEEFRETVEAFQDYNASVTGKDGLQLASEGAEAVAARFSSPSMAWFPWKTLSLLLLIGTAAVVRLDLQRAGGDFRRSNTGQLLADAGQYERAAGGAAWCLEQGGRAHGWAEETLPPYWLHATKVSKPYLDLATIKLGEAGELASLGLTKTRVLARQGMVKLEEAVPGAGARLEEAQVAATKWGVLVAARARAAGLAAREGALLLVRGEVDWLAVKVSLMEGVERAQEQLAALAEFVQVQVRRMVK